MRLSDLERWLDAQGYRLEHVRGSHRQYRHQATHYRITVAVHGGPNSEIRPWQERRILHDIEQMRPVVCATEPTTTTDDHRSNETA